MDYVTHRSHGMQKHMIGITCPGALFMETAPGQPEHEKLCHRCIEMQYVTRRSHRMQKYKFSVTYRYMIFM
jgi:hypothetical protein